MSRALVSTRSRRILLSPALSLAKAIRPLLSSSKVRDREGGHGKGAPRSTSSRPGSHWHNPAEPEPTRLLFPTVKDFAPKALGMNKGYRLILWARHKSL